MADVVNPQITDDDKGPTEKLRDDEKAETGKLVPEDAGVPGAQKPDNDDIKHEKGLNTE
jgi:hypothetical protein